ncbi:MAG TPA: HAMP domain-containing sensor histidine kinase [Gemmatimonadales bacterium]|nr:HAMP domain-containing sensor histidine kinase [Gemmatimonadales bacterium]
MSFRTRLLLAFALAALVPLGVLAVGVRREMAARLGAQADRRVASLVGVLRADLATESRSTRARLHALGQELAADNRFRLAVLETGASDTSDAGDAERRWLLDWAGEAMRLGGLAVLQVQNDSGRILSSGHFRNEYDRLAPALPAAVARAARTARTDSAVGVLLDVRTPQGALLALADVDSFEVGGRRFTLVGGRALDSAAVARLAPAAELAVRLQMPGDTAPRVGDAVVARLPLAHVAPHGAAADSFALDTAQLVVTQDRSALYALRRGLDRWIALALGATLLLALGLGAWLAARVSRPLAELAAKTERVDLDRLDQQFGTGADAVRDDEIGALARLLDAMTARLRAGAARLREAERRTAVGDVARQVNHDIKNGLAPIRHVLRHLTQVAEQEPERLAAIWLERRGTLESSVAYLEDLARNYARLSPALDRAACDPNAALAEVARTVEGRHADAAIETRLAAGVPAVRADPVVLRRILENLAGNAVDALDGRPGRVTLASEAVPDGVRLTVADTGRGMTRAELERAFDDFYTTKDGGTGLGLSVVRRLVLDLGGTLRVETAPGQGSRFIVEIPTA